MGIAETPIPALHFCGVLFSEDAHIAAARRELEMSFGAAGMESACFDFTQTDYYEAEMGAGLRKIFIAFERLISPDEIAGIKLKTNEIEIKLAGEFPRPNASRPVNLDPGYLTAPKMVLATTKDARHRIYIAEGIHAEPTLYFENKTFHHWPWTYPDYCTPGYIEFFNELRRWYMSKIKKAGKEPRQ